jgi:predicted CoA-binding protein
MSQPKPTLVLGATPNENRYAFRATNMLLSAGHPVILVGNKSGSIQGNAILNEFPQNRDIHTITLYLGAPRQREYYDAILESGVQRIIFNPGTQNPELSTRAEKKGIECINACNLVMLATDQY